MVKVDEVFSKRNMRILNLVATLLVIIAWIARFYYITKREIIVEKEF